MGGGRMVQSARAFPALCRRGGRPSSCRRSVWRPLSSRSARSGRHGGQTGTVFLRTTVPGIRGASRSGRRTASLPSARSGTAPRGQGPAAPLRTTAPGVRGACRPGRWRKASLRSTRTGTAPGRTRQGPHPSEPPFQREKRQPTGAVEESLHRVPASFATSMKSRTCRERFDRFQTSTVRLRNCGCMIGRTSTLRPRNPIRLSG